MKDNNKDFKTMLSKTEFGTLTFPEEAKLHVLSEMKKGITYTKNKKSKKRVAFIIAPIAVICLLFLSLTQAPIQKILADVPIFKSIFQKNGDEGLQIASKEKIAQIINQRMTDQDTTVTIKEVLFDGGRISIGYSVDSKTKQVSLIGGNDRIYINGERFEDYSMAETGSNYTNNRHHLDSVITYDLSSTLPDHFTFRIRVESLGDPFMGEIKGKWDFTFDVQKKGKSFEYQPNVLAKSGDTTLKVNKLLLSSTVTKIAYEKTVKTNKMPEMNQSVQYKLYDDQGKEINTVLAASTMINLKNGFLTEKANLYYNPLKKVPKYLLLKPYVQTYSKSGPLHMHEKNITAPLPITLTQRNGKIIITNIKERKDLMELWVYYEIKGDIPDTRSVYFSLNKGKQYKFQNHINNKSIVPGKLNNNRKQIAKFDTLYSDDLVFYTADLYLSWLKGLEVKIPIDQKELKEVK